MMRDELINLIFSVVMAFEINAAMTKMLTMRYPRFYIFAVPILTAGMRIILNVSGAGGFSDLIITAAQLFFLLYLAEDRMIYRFFAFGFQLFGMFIVEWFGITFFTAMGIDVSGEMISNLFVSPGAYLLVRAISFLLAGIIFYIQVVLWNSIVKKSGEQNLLFFVIFPTSQGLLLWYLCDVARRAGSHQNDFLMIGFLTLVGIAADILMLWAIRRLRDADEMRQRAGFLEEQMTRQQAYYERIVHDAEETAKVRHDLRNQIAAASMLFEQGDCATARKMLDTLGGRIASVQYFCQNHVINAVMNEKAEFCRSAGIRLNCEIGLGEKIDLDEMDLCSLFSNVMDNAINGCRSSGEKAPFIAVKAFEKQGFLVLHSRNTAKAAQPGNAKRSWKSAHGWGLTILEDLTKRLDGHFETGFDQGIYEIKIMLKCGGTSAI